MEPAKLPKRAAGEECIRAAGLVPAGLLLHAASRRACPDGVNTAGASLPLANADWLTALASVPVKVRSLFIPPPFTSPFACFSTRQPGTGFAHIETPIGQDAGDHRVAGMLGPPVAGVMPNASDICTGRALGERRSSTQIPRSFMEVTKRNVVPISWRRTTASWTQRKTRRHARPGWCQDSRRPSDQLYRPHQLAMFARLTA